MKNDEIKKMIEDVYDDSREDSIRSMVGDFYSRRMLSIAVLVWIWAIVFMAGAVAGAVKFFAADQTKDQIMYAALFVCLVQFVGLMKVFAWQMMARNSVKREIKRLELRIAELAQALGKAA
jgi:membrane protein YdbS with pleckstrin-like domain